MRRPAIAALAAVTMLAACGDGAPQLFAVPLASTGYASTGDAAFEGVRFNLGEVPVLSLNINNTTVTRQQVIAVFSATEGRVTLTLGDETQLLTTPDEGPADVYTGSVLGTEMLLRRGVRTAEGGELMLVSSDDTGTATRLLALVAAGFDTAPAEIDALSGTALYSGEVVALWARGQDTALASGGLTLTANFDTGRISGAAALTDAGAGTGGLVVPAFSLGFEDGRMTASGFEGLLTAEGADPDSTVFADGSFAGHFLGSGAPAAGGELSTTAIDGGFAVSLQGGFLASRE